MKKMTKICNKGFSLVELVIVVAIVAVLGAVALTGMSLLTSKPVDECAKKIQIALEGNRSTTMGKYSGYLEFTADTDGIYVEEYINCTSQGRIKIGQSGVSVMVDSRIMGDATTYTSSLSSLPFKVEFNRADGSLKTQAGVGYVTTFRISRGSRAINVTVDRLTGRVDLE
jgi:prepilin-type N-terminal cleavage/methylation domain-containing protein